MAEGTELQVKCCGGEPRAVQMEREAVGEGWCGRLGFCLSSIYKKGKHKNAFDEVSCLQGASDLVNISGGKMIGHVGDDVRASSGQVQALGWSGGREEWPPRSDSPGMTLLTVPQLHCFVSRSGKHRSLSNLRPLYMPVPFTWNVF